MKLYLLTMTFSRQQHAGQLSVGSSMQHAQIGIFDGAISDDIG